MSSVTQMKCACIPCLCIVSLSDALIKEGKYYCSEACANGHIDGKECTHSGCNCNTKVAA